MGLKTKRPTKMHLEALEINRQGERFSGLEDQKTFFFFNPKQLRIYHLVSRNKRKHAVKTGHQMWGLLLLLPPIQARQHI